MHIEVSRGAERASRHLEVHFPDNEKRRTCGTHGMRGWGERDGYDGWDGWGVDKLDK